MRTYYISFPEASNQDEINMKFRGQTRTRDTLKYANNREKEKIAILGR